MKSTYRFRAFGLIVATLITVAFVNPAAAEIAIDEIGYSCYYRDFPWNPPQQREGWCQNGDATEFYMTLSGDYMDSGNVMIRVSHPTQAHALAWLARPRFVRFAAGGQIKIKIRIQGIYYGTSDPDNVVTGIPVEIAVTTARSLDFTDDWLFWIGWEGDLYTPDPGKG